MSKISKEFFVSDNDFNKIVKYKETLVALRCKDESKFEGLVEKAVNKITITYEIDREITVKESDIDKLLDGVAFSSNDISIIKQKLFGGNENDV